MDQFTPAVAAEGARTLADPAGRPPGLRRAAQALRIAAHTPAADADAWCERLETGLRELQAAWTRHTADNESPGGFFDQVREEAPQLDPRLRQLQREHDRLHVTIMTALEHLGGDGRRGDPQQVVTDIDGLLALLSRHEQRGADVIYQAYEVDTGGGD